MILEKIVVELSKKDLTKLFEKWYDNVVIKDNYEDKRDYVDYMVNKFVEMYNKVKEEETGNVK